ncbi:rhomboid family intramembrane serine protease [bacterium]|nr:rhomboid family intramembrane serine protease [candidate division CSSED10-310 bacterium]
MQVRYNSPVVLTITLIALAVLIADKLTGGRLSPAFFAVYPTFTFTSPLSYFRLVSHVFGHAGWTHLVGNFTFILLIGPILEEKYGAFALLEMIFVTALITGLLNVLLFPTALMGASGIVFMFILLSSFTNFKVGEIPLTFILIAALFLVKEFLQAFNADSISQFAHILGGLCGAGFGFFYKEPKSN